MKSLTVMIYFIMMVIQNVYRSPWIDYTWYAVLLSCFLIGVIKKNLYLSKRFIEMILVFSLCAIINIIAVGNNSISSILFTVLYSGIYIFLMDETIDMNYVKIAIYIDCAIIIFFILKTGLGQPILTELSNNFISVLLFFPTFYYYIKAEYFHMKFGIVPAIVVMITCLLALGRGGIISSVVFAVFILMYWIFSWMKQNRIYGKTGMRLMIFIFLIVLIVLIILNFHLIQEFSVFQRFKKYGMYGTGRISIWKEYFTTMLSRLKNLLFGVKYSDLPLMVTFRNNLHNSFLNVHADYGILATLYLLCMFLFSFLRCIKSKKWVYFSVVLVLFIRSMTDKIFGGGSVGTPLLFFVLLFIREPDFQVLSKKYEFDF